MKATDLLKHQHREIRDLFERLERAKDDESKSELFEELATNLVAHDAIERQVFYPACEERMGMSDLLGEALVEHGLVEFSLYLADQARGEEDFEYKCSVLREILEHHLEEEENTFFPKVERAFGKTRLEELTEELEERFEAAKEEDFRVALHANLEQVLQGAIKPVPRRRARASNRKKISTRRVLKKSA